MNNSIRILGAGLICVDVVRNSSSTIIMNGGSCANVISVLAQIGYDCTVLREKYSGTSELFLSNTLASLGVKEIFYKQSRSSAPRIIETLSDFEHSFYTTCPCCGKKILSLKLPSISEVQTIEDQIHDIDVFYCDRTSSGIRHLMDLVSSKGGFAIYEPNSARNLKGLIESSAMADILKFSKDRIPASVAEKIRTECRKIKLIISTDGARGLSFSYRKKSGDMSSWTTLPSAFSGPVIDSSGAGDWLTAGFLSELFTDRNALSLDRLSDVDEISNMLNRGMKYSQLCCAAIGAQGAFYSPNYPNELRKLTWHGVEQESPRLEFQNVLTQDVCPVCFSDSPKRNPVVGA